MKIWRNSESGEKLGRPFCLRGEEWKSGGEVGGWGGEGCLRVETSREWKRNREIERGRGRGGAALSQTCRRPPRGGCRRRRERPSPLWPAVPGRPAGKRGRRGRRRWWRRAGWAGSGPAAGGSWAAPGPGAETAGGPGAAATRNTSARHLDSICASRESNAISPDAKALMDHA